MEKLQIDKKTKLAAYKLLSEEWLAATMYEQMILGCKSDDRHII
jgi:hypothetical protein